VSRKEVLAMAGIIQNIGGPPRGIDIPSIEPQGIDGRTRKGSEGEKQHRGRRGGGEEGRRGGGLERKMGGRMMRR
jgi:hypothetical protein